MLIFKSCFNPAFLFVKNIRSTTRYSFGYFDSRFLSSCLPDNIKNHWKERLQAEGIDDAEESVNWIAEHVMKAKNDNDFIAQFDKLCKRRLTREPVQYIIGDWDFRYINLKMRCPVFIPRPETEGLIDLIHENINKEKQTKILEVGCGSGAISLSLAKENKKVFCTAIDISKEAIELSKENCARLDLSAQVTFLNHSLESYEKLPEKKLKFDVIVSNPPYIPTKEMKKLQPEISLYEDQKALNGGKDGLDIILQILSASKGFLSKNGQLWIEVDTTHPLMIKRIIKEQFNDEISYINTYNDIFERPRFCYMKTLI